MFYKSSILAAIFVLLSMGSAIAAELSNLEISIAEQPSELLVNAPHWPAATTKNSASIAKARLLKTPATDIQAATELHTSSDQNSASVAKARLHNLAAKESAVLNSLPTTRSPKMPAASAESHRSKLSIARDPSTAIASKTIKDQIKNTAHTIPYSTTANNKNSQPDNNFTEQPKIADASSKISSIEQWETNRSVTLNDIVLTPAPIKTIAQAPERLPDIPALPTVIETAQPAIIKPINSPGGTQKPVITQPEAQTPVITSGANEAIAPPAPIAKPTSTVIETKNPEPPPSAPQIIEAQKPENLNSEPKKWAVGVHTQLSTTGFIGVDAGYKFSPNLHARLGLNTVGFSLDYASQGINYKANLSPTNVHLLGDFFPFGGGLRLTGGLVLQSNQFNATGTPSSSIANGITQVNIGGADYNISDVGTVSSEGSFSNSVAPYLGIGFGTPLSPGLGFNFDAGVIFAGSPRVRLRANIPSSVREDTQTDIRNSLAEQERRTNNDISSFSVYPVVSIGISYAF